MEETVLEVLTEKVQKQLGWLGLGSMWKIGQCLGPVAGALQTIMTEGVELFHRMAKREMGRLRRRFSAQVSKPRAWMSQPAASVYRPAVVLAVEETAGVSQWGRRAGGPTRKNTTGTARPRWLRLMWAGLGLGQMWFMHGGSRW